jgi:alpha-L-rhamnosidase
LEPGYTTFKVIPHPGSVERASAEILSVKGKIQSAFINKKGRFELRVVVPEGINAIIGVPQRNYALVTANQQEAWQKGKFIAGNKVERAEQNNHGYLSFKVGPGEWTFIATN